MQLLALNRPQLEHAHAEMKAWTDRQIGKMEAEVAEWDACITEAQKGGFPVAPFERRIASARRRIIFYEKVGKALEAGYAIVPNFQMDVFAIRTDRKNPTGGREGHYNNFPQEPRLLPAGQGRYVSDLPTVSTRKTTDDKGKEMTWQEAVDFTEVDFPLELAKPELIGATASAMASKLFDEVGVAQDWNRGARGDPVIIGRILNPRKGGAAMCFFIGWFLDVSRI